MALSPGTRFGAYEIVSLLGAGGMGEVYRACDTKLDREVAIKVLPERFVSDPERVTRFQREAKALAALNHPHIGGIYGLEDANEMHGLVLELVEGPTLAERIAQGPIRLDEALSIARQIAEALEAAHEQGIIHRDLKPANIKVRPDGVVKVLDFGVAKIGARDLARQDFLQLATVTADATRYGVILGTTVYMSPEQARGFSIDQRTDVWAFGCVLYEMLSGRSAFRGNTIADTTAKILEHEPDWQALPRSTPRAVRELIRRCVRKDLQHRLHDLAIVHRQIDDAATRLVSQRKLDGRLRLVAAALALTIVTVAWWQPWSMIRREFALTPRHQPASTQHEPVTILIADFQNHTGDPTFDHTLEPMLRLALEGASFISAQDRTRLRAIGVTPPEKLDEAAARQIAIKQAFGIVVSGSIDRGGEGYEISLKAAHPISGNIASNVKARAPSKDEVLGSVTKLAAGVRKALGEKTSETDQLFAMRNISSSSLAVIGEYAAGIELQSKGKYEDAIQRFRKAVEIDPNFGPAYNSLSVNLRNVGRIEESEKSAKEALRHLDRMTERERFATRGNYYRITGDLQQCITEYGELIARYAADTVAHNNRALCLVALGDMRGAMDEMRKAIQILPNHPVYRTNFALFATYAGDFEAAEREARAIQNPSARALFPLALSLLGQGRLREAAEGYEKLSTMGTFGASWSASGLGDLALYEGRLSDAMQIFERGAAVDLAAKNTGNAALKLAALAYVHLVRGQTGAAVAAAEQALLVKSNSGTIRFEAARVLAQAGAIARARSEAARISLGLFVSSGLTGAGGLAVKPEAYAKIIEAEIALSNEDSREAIKLLTEGNTLADTWLGHFDLGLAYLKVPAFAKANAEFDICLKRRGEAIALIDEDPTYGLFPPVLYYQGVAREGLNRADSAESFRAYMDIRGKSTEDPLMQKLRQRFRP